MRRHFAPASPAGDRLIVEFTMLDACCLFMSEDVSAEFEAETI